MQWPWVRVWFESGSSLALALFCMSTPISLSLPAFRHTLSKNCPVKQRKSPPRNICVGLSLCYTTVCSRPRSAIFVSGGQRQPPEQPEQQPVRPQSGPPEQPEQQPVRPESGLCQPQQRGQQQPAQLRTGETSPHTHTLTHTLTHSHTHSLTHTHTLTHTPTHTNTHTLSHTHTQDRKRVV